MIEVVTYKLASGNAVYQWLAFVVLPNNKLWDVRFSGSTEEEARSSALRVWNSEQTRLAKSPLVNLDKPSPDGSQAAKLTSDDPWAAEVKEHHFTGKVWMRHKETRKLERVPLTEIGMYERNGYERSGPRSK